MADVRCLLILYAGCLRVSILKQTKESGRSITFAPFCKCAFLLVAALALVHLVGMIAL